jgi:hypothetical protein
VKEISKSHAIQKAYTFKCPVGIPVRLANSRGVDLDEALRAIGGGREGIAPCLGDVLPLCLGDLGDPALGDDGDFSSSLSSSSSSSVYINI